MIYSVLTHHAVLGVTAHLRWHPLLNRAETSDIHVTSFLFVFSKNREDILAVTASSATRVFRTKNNDLRCPHPPQCESSRAKFWPELSAKKAC